MTAEDLLNLNGDFRSSPLLGTARKLHKLLAQQDIPYVIIGGLSVIRKPAVRTTCDVDLLVRKEDWPRIQEALANGFAIEIDSDRNISAFDRDTSVQLDILFAGDDWGLIVPLPDPVTVLEYDSVLQANFLTLPAILELKTATCLQKKRDEGIEIAAKDLSDVVELLNNNRKNLLPEFFAGLHPRIRKELERIKKKLHRRTGRSS